MYRTHIVLKPSRKHHIDYLTKIDQQYAKGVFLEVDKFKSYRRVSHSCLGMEVAKVNAVEIIAVENLPLITKGDNIAELICNAAKKQDTPIQEKDVLVITHVAVSKAEGTVVNLDEVSPSESDKEIARKTGKEPELVEVILRETKEIVRIGPKRLITETKSGIVCANAGVDRSNVDGERKGVLLPKNPDASAQKIRQEIKRLK